jgi:hypothetical protein
MMAGIYSLHREVIVMIASYADLLRTAAQQPQPQRLLFVFTKAELPPDHSSIQKQRFENQQGGELLPIMCVDKLTEELGDFDGLVAESKHMGKAWDIVFVSTMSGKSGVAPTSKEADRPLDSMIESIKSGNISHYLAFNLSGELVHFSAIG